MASASLALLFATALPTAVAAATSASVEDAESCSVTAGSTQGSVMLQVARGAEKKMVSSDEVLPELPPAFAEKMAVSSDGGVIHPSLLQRDGPSAEELEHFRLMQELRTSGYTCPGGKYFAPIPDTKATFKFDCRLWQAARFWSMEMASKGFFSHVQGNSNPCQRTYDYGLLACTENIARANPDPTVTFQQWKDSDGHCTNMMDPDLNRFGLGYVNYPGSEYVHYWTQSLGTSNDAADESCLVGSSDGSGTSPAVTSQPPPFDGPCEDKDFHCSTSYKNFCHTENIKNSCPLTCGLCTVPEPEVTSPPVEPEVPSQPPSDGPCEDKDFYCPTAYKNFCHTENIKNSCPLTCGLCTAPEPEVTRPPAEPEAPSQPPSDGPCEDKDFHCPTAYKNFCHIENIKNSCPLTCGLCTAPEPEVTNQAPNDDACEDKDFHCSKSYKNFCHLSNVKSSCPKTCGVCN